LQRLALQKIRSNTAQRQIGSAQFCFVSGSFLPLVLMQTSAFTPCDLPADALELGGIAAPWGVKGWFKVHAHSDSPEALFHARDWYLLPSDRPRKKPLPATEQAPQALAAPVFTGCVRVRIREIKPHGSGIVAQIRDVDDRNITEALQGSRIFIPRSKFPPPKKGEFYWADLLGMRVINRQGQDLGEVSDLLSTGPQTVLVIRNPGSDAERMIPFVDAYIDAVDQPERRIRVDWQADYDL
jgi:16S rRNA processing protein RimM